MRVILTTAGLLTCSNVFMTFAWYAHLRDLRNKAWYVAAIVSWSIALSAWSVDAPLSRSPAWLIEPQTRRSPNS